MWYTIFGGRSGKKKKKKENKNKENFTSSIYSNYFTRRNYSFNK